MKVIECSSLSKNYGRTKALCDMSAEIYENRITGNNSIDSFELCMFKNDFTVNQFTGDYSDSTLNFIREVRILYMEIPKTLKIGEAPPANYVN